MPILKITVADEKNRQKSFKKEHFTKIIS